MHGRNCKDVKISFSVPNIKNIFFVHFQNCAGEPIRNPAREQALCYDEELVCCPKTENKPLVCDENDGFTCTPDDVSQL